MAKYRVACLEVYPQEVVAAIEAQVPDDFELVCAKSHDEQERLDLVSTADFVIFAGPFVLSGKHMDAAPKLKLIQKWGIGVDAIDLEAAAARGIPVAITAGSNAVAVAEHTVMLMLAVNKSLCYMDHNLRLGRWLKQESRTRSYLLNGKTVGIVGFGHIGREVAARLRVFGCRVIYHDQFRVPAQVELQLRAEYRTLDGLMAEADVVTLHVPLLPCTRNLIDARRLALMKPNAILINCARGGVVDEASLVDALKPGRLRGAGIDVFADEPVKAGNPLLALDNVVLTPHSAGDTIDNAPNEARHCFDNMLRVVRGEPLPEADIVCPSGHGVRVRGSGETTR